MRVLHIKPTAGARTRVVHTRSGKSTELVACNGLLIRDKYAVRTLPDSLRLKNDWHGRLFKEADVFSVDGHCEPLCVCPMTRPERGSPSCQHCARRRLNTLLGGKCTNVKQGGHGSETGTLSILHRRQWAERHDYSS